MTDINKVGGIVYLVGAGPGDPELITLKGKRLIENADVLLFDFLAPEEFLDWAPAAAEKIYVGKQGGKHTLPQQLINKILVEKAREGKRVVRLKGGDPFIFGRGGEEAEILADAGVKFELVPGISSAVGGALYAGIPLTHRDCTSSVVFVTGHESQDKECSSIPWENIARAGHTIVIFMGMKNIGMNMNCLIEGGIDPKTPVAIIRWGTRPDQRTITGTVESIADEVERTGIKAPAIIVIGKVVELREKLKWFDLKPLFGKRILVTRTREQAGDISMRLREAGAYVYEVPTIEITPTIDDPEVKSAVQRLAEFDWVIFTSVNGVKLLLDAIRNNGGDSRDLAGKKIAAIGPATARKIEETGIKVDLVPSEYKAEGLAEALGAEGINGKKFLLARARIARDVLPKTLTEKGGDVVIAPLYDTRTPEQSAQKIKDLLSEEKIDIAVFASSSTAENFFNMAGDADLSNITIACIGPITAETVRKRGLDVHIQPEEYTIPALVNKIIAKYSS